MDQSPENQTTAKIETSASAKRPRKTAEDKERELQEKIAQMEARLKKLKQTRIDRQAKNLDKIWQRLRIELLDLELGDVPEEALRAVIVENIEKLRQAIPASE